MLEVDPTVIHPEELVARVRRKLGKPVEGPGVPGASASAAPPALAHLDDHVRQLHSSWYPGEVGISSHRKVIGPVLVFGKKAIRKVLKWYVDTRWIRQSDFNGAVTRAVADLTRLGKETAGSVAALQAELAETKAALEAAQKGEADLRTAIAELRESQEHEISRLRHDVANLVEHARGEYAPLGALFNQLREEQNYLASRVSRLQSGSAPAAAQAQPVAAPVEGGADIDYVLFENRFRGSREAIKAHFEALVPHFEGSFDGRGTVVDIGCGRGEMLELLMARGVKAVGVDLSAEMVAYCQDRGLPVVYGDAIAYLTDQPDASLGGIFMSQVIEHLTTAQWAHFLDVAREKLRPGGTLLIETINPGSHFAMAHSYYKDLTHVRPVHPETLQFVAETKGYRETQLVMRSPHPALATATDETRALTEAVFGHMDYALVARR